MLMIWCATSRRWALRGSVVSPADSASDRCSFVAKGVWENKPASEQIRGLERWISAYLVLDTCSTLEDATSTLTVRLPSACQFPSINSFNLRKHSEYLYEHEHPTFFLENKPCIIYRPDTCGNLGIPPPLRKKSRKTYLVTWIASDSWLRRLRQ